MWTSLKVPPTLHSKAKSLEETEEHMDHSSEVFGIFGQV